MNVLSSDLDIVLKDVQGMLHEGMPAFDANADSLSWLNVSSIFILAILLSQLSALSIFCAANLFQVDGFVQNTSSILE